MTSEETRNLVQTGPMPSNKFQPLQYNVPGSNMMGTGNAYDSSMLNLANMDKAQSSSLYNTLKSAVDAQLLAMHGDPAKYASLDAAYPLMRRETQPLVNPFRNYAYDKGNGTWDVMDFSAYGNRFDATPPPPGRVSMDRRAQVVDQGLAGTPGAPALVTSRPPSMLPGRPIGWDMPQRFGTQPMGPGSSFGLSDIPMGSPVRPPWNGNAPAPGPGWDPIPLAGTGAKGPAWNATQSKLSGGLANAGLSGGPATGGGAMNRFGGGAMTSGRSSLAELLRRFLR